MDIEIYKDYLNRLPVSGHTRRNYLLRVRRYLLWLDEMPEGAKAITNPVERNFAVQQYKLWMLNKGASANTLNSVLAAIDNFYLFMGLGPTNIRRQSLPAQAPRALAPEEQHRLAKAIAKCDSLRNRAIVSVMLHCGLRISEVAQLNVSDVLMAARKRELVVRCGKGSKRRSVPINSELGEVLQNYMSLRSAPANAPLFCSQKGNRLSVQAIDSVIRSFGRDAGVEFSSHCLRHYSECRIMPSRFSGFCEYTIQQSRKPHSLTKTTRHNFLATNRSEMQVADRRV